MGQEMGDGRGHVPAMTPGQYISGGDAVPFSPGRPDGFDGYGGVHQRPVHVEEDRLKSASRGSVRVIVISVLPG